MHAFRGIKSSRMHAEMHAFMYVFMHADVYGDAYYVPCSSMFK